MLIWNVIAPIVAVLGIIATIGIWVLAFSEDIWKGF